MKLEKEIPQESYGGTEVAKWPETGELRLENVNCSYSGKAVL